MKASHSDVKRLLSTARGQIDGIIKMIDEDRYCVDVSHQIQAASALLRKANKEVLASHMKCCIVDAAKNDDEQKIDEMIKLLDSLLK